jgi:hypothetical protein
MSSHGDARTRIPIVAWWAQFTESVLGDIAAGQQRSLSHATGALETLIRGTRLSDASLTKAQHSAADAADAKMRAFSKSITHEQCRLACFHAVALAKQGVATEGRCASELTSEYAFLLTTLSSSVREHCRRHAEELERTEEVRSRFLDAASSHRNRSSGMEVAFCDEATRIVNDEFERHVSSGATLVADETTRLARELLQSQRTARGASREDNLNTAREHLTKAREFAAFSYPQDCLNVHGLSVALEEWVSASSWLSDSACLKHIVASDCLSSIKLLMDHANSVREDRAEEEAA